MNRAKKNNQIKQRRAKRTRAKLFGTLETPRLSVFRSGRYTYAQLIDDEKGKTLAAVATKSIGLPAAGGKKSATKTDSAVALGQEIGKKAKDLKIKSAIFDRGENKYHGRVKAVAEGARKEGLQI